MFYILSSDIMHILHLLLIPEGILVAVFAAAEGVFLGTADLLPRLPFNRLLLIQHCNQIAAEKLWDAPSLLFYY